MARRKNDLASKLQSGNSRPGWRDAITGGQEPAEPAGAEQPTHRSRRQPRVSSPEEEESSLKRKTYLLTPELIDEIALLAETDRVGISELVRFLLRSALDQVEQGQLEIPTAPGTRKIVQ